MLRLIKEKIWRVLEEKEVSLVMLYDHQGKIIWHKGREIHGQTVSEGKGFSKTYIKEAFLSGQICDRRGFLLSGEETSYPVSSSATYLHIKSILIQKVNQNFYLYVDSGTKKAFTEYDCEVFKTLGRILGETIHTLEETQEKMSEITGESPKIKNIKESIMKYAMADDPILLLGETGTGKTHIANVIHRYSGRNGKFKVINTPGIPENLFESEMFGHSKGAFTDAKQEKKGLVEDAVGGTLFIDEITEVSVSMQAKLLRFIETGKYTRLGETCERDVDVRIIAATNKNLRQAIQSNEFREDLYYRLNVFQIELPPLRERKQDLKVLVEQNRHFLQNKSIGIDFWSAMSDYSWPGNIRELISVLKRMGYYRKDILDGDGVKEIIKGYSGDHHSIGPNNREIEIMHLWNNIIGGGDFWEIIKKPFLARDLKRTEVKQVISMGLKQSQGKYKNLLELFNLQPNDYHRFMRFLTEQNLKP